VRRRAGRLRKRTARAGGQRVAQVQAVGAAACDSSGGR
jgi:hypothetical protein